MKLLAIKEILTFLFHTLTTWKMRMWLAKQVTGMTKWEWDDSLPDLAEAYKDKDYERAMAAIQEMYAAAKRDLKD